MEEEFILPEGEKANTSNKIFLLIAVPLFASLILLSAALITLLLSERHENMATILVTPTPSPTVVREHIITATMTSFVPQITTPTVTNTAILTPTITVEKGDHYVVIYINPTPSKQMTVTPTPSGALQIIPYPDMTSIENNDVVPGGGN
ncbi:MAG: hypothetical protein GWP61_11845 [Chloroflexi bacterium]|jgi:hypothetical protein|nr:hypothetical protein [Chloroflexota bacterium]